MTTNNPEKQTNVDKDVEQALESTRKVDAVFAAYLRSGEKLEFERRPDGVYWVLGEEDGPFNSEAEARQGFKRYGEGRLERERRGE